MHLLPLLRGGAPPRRLPELRRQPHPPPRPPRGADGEISAKHAPRPAQNADGLTQAAASGGISGCLRLVRETDPEITRALLPVRGVRNRLKIEARARRYRPRRYGGFCPG